MVHDKPPSLRRCNGDRRLQLWPWHVAHITNITSRMQWPHHVRVCPFTHRINLVNGSGVCHLSSQAEVQTIMQCANAAQSDSVMNKVDRRLSKLSTKLFVTSREELIVVDSACCVPRFKKQKTNKTATYRDRKRRVFGDDLLNY